MANTPTKVVLLAVLTSACHNLLGTPKVVDTWDRSRQRADFADRFATRFQQGSERSPQGAQVMGWTNHYNHTEKRCFVEIALYDPTAGRDNPRALPLTHIRLFDAVEGLPLAVHARADTAEGVRGQFCAVPSPNGDRSIVETDCATAHKFIVERMTN
jgi:hypothetical protein